MKVKTMLSTVIIALMSVGVAFAETSKEKFKVHGNCGMCESRIEKAAKSVEGVSTANWNQETQMVEVSYDKSKTDIEKIHMAIAKAGHDTEMHKAEEKAYNALPDCCKYSRSEKKKDCHDGHKY